MKLGIIIQGPTSFCHKVNEHYAGQDFIWSTWHSEPVENKDFLNKNSTTIMQVPNCNPGPRNINLQLQSTLAGAMYLDSLGYDYVFKIRSDVLIHHEIADIIDPTKPSFLCWHDHRGGYLVDYFFGGPTKMMIDLCNFEIFEDAGIPVERYITNRLIGLGERKIHSILPHVSRIDWLKNGTNIVENCKHHLYRVVDTI